MTRREPRKKVCPASTYVLVAESAIRGIPGASFSIV